MTDGSRVTVKLVWLRYSPGLVIGATATHSRNDCIFIKEIMTRAHRLGGAACTRAHRRVGGSSCTSAAIRSSRRQRARPCPTSRQSPIPWAIPIHVRALARAATGAQQQSSQLVWLWALEQAPQPTLPEWPATQARAYARRQPVQCIQSPNPTVRSLELFFPNTTPNPCSLDP